MRKAIKYDALQLADDLVKWPYERYEAAAELRRLHALNAELREALREMLKLWQDDPVYGHATADKALELLVKAEASK